MSKMIDQGPFDSGADFRNLLPTKSILCPLLSTFIYLNSFQRINELKSEKVITMYDNGKCRILAETNGSL